MLNNCYSMVHSFKTLIVLIIFLWYTILCVIAGPSDNVELIEDFPGSHDQEVELAAAVCAELGLIHSSICRKRFLEARGTFDEPPPELQIKCRSEKTVTFVNTPTAHWQLVISVNKENDKDIIMYRLIEGSADVKINTIYTGYLSKTYTLWTTILDVAGNHSVWRRGPDVIPWENVTQQLEPRQYGIEFEFLLEKYTSGPELEAKFYWNASDDSCFRVHNLCNKKALGNFFEKEIKPDDEKWVVVKDVPFDDRCTFTVHGHYGDSTLEYSTPACHLVPGCDPPPEEVKNLTVTVSEDAGGQWVVEVTWAEPRYPQDWYDVTLTTDRPQSIVIPGNTSGVVFSDVVGEGWYEVYVTSVLSNRTAVTGRIYVFPSRAQGAKGLLVGAAWVTLLVAVLVTAALFWCRKRQHDKTRGQYYASIQEMAMKFSESESGNEVVEDHWEVRPELLSLHEVLGEGAFGVVRRGILAPGNREVAVKMLKEYPSAEETRSFRSEMELMKSVGAHAHVVSLLACCSSRRPLLVVEYCSRGNLLSYLRRSWDTMEAKRNARYCNNNKEVEYRNDLFTSKGLVVNQLYDLQAGDELSLPDLLSFCRQIAKGMEFLGANRVVHRDLAARNVLVTADRTLKIADFGLSRDVYQENQYKQKGNGKMPLKWMALESLTHRVYTSQSDVWSFGVVMWEVLTLGGAPYEALDCAQLPRLLRSGYRMPRPEMCEPQLYEVMLACWNARARSRPTFAQLHARLDALLAASAHPYLPLHLQPAAHPALPAPALAPAHVTAALAPYRYVRMLFRSERVWGRGRNYDWPTCPAKRNYYTPHPPHAVVTPRRTLGELSNRSSVDRSWLDDALLEREVAIVRLDAAESTCVERPRVVVILKE